MLYADKIKKINLNLNLNLMVCGVKKLDKIRNEIIRGTTKVGAITKKAEYIDYY